MDEAEQILQDELAKISSSVSSELLSEYFSLQRQHQFTSDVERGQVISKIRSLVTKAANQLAEMESAT